MNDLETREEALSHTRDALAALRKIPAAGVSHDQAGEVISVIEDVDSLERALSNEVDQLRGER